MLDRSRPYRLVPSITIRPTGFDTWDVAADAHSPDCAQLDSMALRLLSCFAETSTAEQALARLGGVELPDEAVESFVELRLIVDPDDARGPPASVAYFSDYDGGLYSADSVTGITENLEKDARLAGIAPSLAGLRILDVGCATGQLVVLLRDAGALAYGIEVARWALERTTRRAAPYVFRVDARDLGVFPDGAFDLVVANITPHIGASSMATWLRGVARIAARGVYLRYVTAKWIADFVRDRGPEVAARMDLDWSRPDAWWRAQFGLAGLRILHERRDDVWDAWVLLGR